MYYIEQSCLKCDACDHTGWKKVDIANDRKRAKELRKHWQRYLGNDVKVRYKKMYPERKNNG